MKMMMRNKITTALALVMFLGVLFAGCSTGGNAAPAQTENTENEAAVVEEEEAAPEPVKEPRDMTNPVIEITMESGGVITVELDPEAAPITVANFLKLVDEEFYDGLIFHRVIPNFMIQGGDPTGTGTGGADEKIKGEFAANGWDNPISHKRGVISMARSQNMDSASCQFFITNTDATFLDGEYAAFGVVTSGMEVVDEISAVPTDTNDKPKTPVVIKTIRRI